MSPRSEITRTVPVGVTVPVLGENAMEATLLRNAKPGVDTYEIWFGRPLCAPGGRVLAGCAKA